MAGLRRTPVYKAHVRRGARMVEFAGFLMPVQYTSIRAEHTAVREAAGLFDVSHMGQIALDGPAAVATAEKLLTRKVSSLRPGGVRYGLLCNEEGGVVDDVTFYRLAESALFLVVNAANVEKAYRWAVRHSTPEAGVRNTSEETAMFAVQGPASGDVMKAVCETDVTALKRYRFDRAEVAGCSALVSRTGYTGSDGFEIFSGAGDAERVFEALLERGAGFGLVPAGLGCRDTLRLEAALPLYGHELDDVTSPLDAGLGRFVELEGRDFLGAKAIALHWEAGSQRTLVGFELVGRGVARAEHAVAVDGEVIGRVTSGAPSPTLGKSIGLAYVPPAVASPGQRIDIVIRSRAVEARVVETPFV
ncbi:MAG: glycine cleavage system aminomethyltransferase GcvT [Myxococcota bacterium]